MHGRSLILRGVALTYVSLAAGLGSMLVLTPILLTSLGAAGYGLWAILNSLVGYFMLMDFGMNTAVVKYTADYRATGRREHLGRMVSTILALVGVIDVLVLALALVAMKWIPDLFHVTGDLAPAAALAFLLTAVTVAVMLAGGVLGNVIYGEQRVDVYKLFAVLQIAANAGLAVLALRLGWGLVGVAGAALVSALGLVVLYVVFLRAGDYRLALSLRQVRLDSAREIAPFALRTFVLGLTGRLLYYSDYLVIGLLLGPGAVAGYEIAYKLCFLSTYLFSAVSTTVFPRSAALGATGDAEALGRLYLRLAKLSFALMVPTGLFLGLFGEATIRLWVGEGNFAGVAVLAVLIVMNVFHAIGTPGAMLLQSAGRNRGLTYAEVVNAVLKLALSILLVQRLGVVGAALGTLAAHLLSSFWVVLLLPCRHLGVPLTRYVGGSLVPPLVAGGAAGGLLWLALPLLTPVRTVLDLLVGGAAVAVVYALVYLAIGSSRAERQTCGRWLRAIPIR